MPVLKMFREKRYFIAFLDNWASEHYLCLTQVVLAEMASALALAKPSATDDSLT